MFSWGYFSTVFDSVSKLTIPGGVIDTEPALQHHLFEVPITERITKIPAHTQENDISLEVAPFEGVLAVIAHEGDLFRSFLSTGADQHFLCNTAEKGDVRGQVALVAKRFEAVA